MTGAVSDPTFVLLPGCVLACERTRLILAFVVHISHPEFLVQLYFQHRQSVRRQHSLLLSPQENTLI